MGRLDPRIAAFIRLVIGAADSAGIDFNAQLTVTCIGDGSIFNAHIVCAVIHNCFHLLHDSLPVSGTRPLRIG